MKYPSFFCTWLFPPACYSIIATLWESSYTYNSDSHVETMNGANLKKRKKKWNSTGSWWCPWVSKLGNHGIFYLCITCYMKTEMVLQKLMAQSILICDLSMNKTIHPISQTQGLDMLLDSLTPHISYPRLVSPSFQICIYSSIHFFLSLLCLPTLIQPICLQDQCHGLQALLFALPFAPL